MPTATVGLDKTLKALRKLSPDVYKEMSKDIRRQMTVLVKEARAEVPLTISGLSSWSKEQVIDTGKRQFPRYNPAEAKRGIKSTIGRQKPNRKGWAATYVIYNASASGTIAETAGRKNPVGKPGSYASRHFIASINDRLAMYHIGQGRKNYGRIIFKVVAKNEGKLTKTILESINKAVDAANKGIKYGS